MKVDTSPLLLDDPQHRARKGGRKSENEPSVSADKPTDTVLPSLVRAASLVGRRSTAVQDDGIARGSSDTRTWENEDRLAIDVIPARALNHREVPIARHPIQIVREMGTTFTG